MTKKEAGKRPYYWDIETLDYYVSDSARSRGFEGWRDTEVTADVLHAAWAFEDYLEDILEKWLEREGAGTLDENRYGEPYEQDALMSARGPYLVYMARIGHGVSITDGDWDHYFQHPRHDIPRLQRFLERDHKLGKLAETLENTIDEAAYETSGQREKEEAQAELERRQDVALPAWRNELEEGLFEGLGKKAGASPAGTLDDLYGLVKKEADFLKGLAPTYKRLSKIRGLLDAEARRINSFPYPKPQGDDIFDAGFKIQDWIDHYKQVLFVSQEARGALAGQLLYDLEKALPGWSLDMAKWKKRPTMVVVPLVKKNGKQAILKAKFQTIDEAELQIGVPGSTVRFSQVAPTSQGRALIEDAKNFLGQLIRLR